MVIGEAVLLSAISGAKITDVGQTLTFGKANKQISKWANSHLSQEM